MKDVQEVTTITDAFPDSKYLRFSTFCKRKGIKYIHELTSGHIQDFSKMNGVGEKKVEAVKQKLFEIKKYIKTINKTNDTHIVDSQAKIEDVFPYDEFRAFWSFCKNNNIKNLSEITENQLSKYAEMQGVGLVKVNAVKQRLNQYNLIYQPSGTTGSKKSENIDPASILSLTAPQKIWDVFHETKFNLFKRYCIKQGIKLVNEITPELLDKFAQSKQVGSQRAEVVRQALKEYIEQADAALTRFHSGELYEEIKEHNVQALLLFYGYQSDSISNLKIKDIEGKSLVDLKEDFNPFLLVELSKSLNKQKTPKEVISKLTSRFSPRELEILRQRYSQGNTIQDVAKNTNLSRERIRQILNDTVKKTSAYLKQEHFSNLVYLISGFKSYISNEELVELLGNEFRYIVDLLKQEKLLFSYFLIFLTWISFLLKRLILLHWRSTCEASLKHLNSKIFFHHHRKSWCLLVSRHHQ